MVWGTNISSHQLVGSDQNHQIIVVNHQAIKLFIVTSATKGVVTTPFRFSVRFKLL